MNKNPFEAIINIFNKLTIQQKFVIAGITLLTVVLLGILIVFLNEPEYSVLYSNLGEEDASKVVEQLNADKVLFQLEDNGKTIKVPKEKLYETRLSLAGKGIPSSGVIGYELFDKNTMGMSDFMQKLNYKRAIEGELARTIMQQDGIEGVRVLITLPQKSVFKNEEKLPTASVVLKLRNGHELNKGTVVSIVNLVASSVEGLQTGKVTLIDNKGRLLSKDEQNDPFAVASSKQYEIKQNVENYLIQKAQMILDNVVGYGNAMVQVNADLNFDQVEKTMETYDPESQVAVSEQTVKSANNGTAMGDSTAQNSENSTVNYEISKTLQKVIEGSGNINRLSVAVVLNDVAKEVKNGENTEIVYEPRNPEQIKKLEDIIKNAVGLNPERQDQFSIVNIPFEAKPLEEFKDAEPSFFDSIDKWTNVILIFAAIIASIFILKGLLNKLKNEKIIIGTFNSNDLAYDTFSAGNDGGMSNGQLGHNKKKTALIPLGDIEDEISEEAAKRKMQTERIINYVSKNPMDAAKLINSWLHEDEF